MQYHQWIFHIIRYLQYSTTRQASLAETEKSRIQNIITELKLIDQALKLTPKLKSSVFTSNIIAECVERIECLLAEPLLNFFPDIHLWLVCGNQPIGICNIKSADVIWSSNKYKKGALCNNYFYTNVKVSFRYFLK